MTTTATSETNANTIADPDFLLFKDGAWCLNTRLQGKEISRTLKAKEEAAARMEARKILADWKDKLRNLWLRNGTWYVVAQVDRRRISRSLDLAEADLDTARARCKAMLAAARAEKWDVLDSTKHAKGFATMAQLAEAFQEEAQKHDLKPKTVADYIRSMALVIGKPAEDWSTISTEILTKEVVRKYCSRMLERLGDEEEDEQSLRRTIKSTVNQARSLVGDDWAMEAYADRELKLPDLTGFKNAFTVKADLVQYRLPDPTRGITWELIAATKKAGGELLGKEDDLAAVWILCYWLGMRAAEAYAARWSWISRDPRDGRDYMEIVNRPGEYFQPKGTEGKVKLPTKVAEWLQELKARADGRSYILPGASETERKNLVTRVFANWMARLGWVTDKKAHELRKLRGSEIFTALGVEAAQHVLRHADIGTTKRSYAAFTHEPPTLEVEE